MPGFDKQTKNRAIKRIIIHCSATKPNQNIGAATIKKWHLDRGWADIGYHYVIRRNGEVETGRDRDGDGDIFEEIGAHTYKYNRDSLGICIVGGIDYDGEPEANFSDKQWNTLRLMVRFLMAEFPNATVHGHNEFANKACPSFLVQPWLRKQDLI